MNPTLKIVLGYVVFFGYMFLEILVGEFLQKKFDLNKEMTRKVEHIATGVCWIIGYFFLGWSIHIFIINAIGLVMLCVITFGDLMKSVEREDMGKSYGIVYFGASTLIVVGILVFVNDSLFAYYGIAYYCLVLADGLAPIVAKLFKKHNLPLVHGKTLAGTATVFVMTGLIALAFNLIFSMGLTPLLILSLASLVAMAELFGAKGTDNITIVLFAFGYLTLAHFGYIDVATQYIVLFAPLLTITSILAGALTPWGQTVSYLIMLVFAFFGGYPFAVLTISLFVAAAIIGKITQKIYFKRAGAQQKTARKAIQILANGGIAVAFAIAYYFSKQTWALYVAFIVIIEEFADSMSSDVGRLSSRQPVDLLRFKRIPTGISGGVSLLGTVTAVVASFAAGLIAFAFFHNALLYLVISAIAFLGTVVDSVFGSLLQGRFVCPVCGTVTEKRVCCDTPTTLTKGFAAVDNCLVNFLSGAVTAGVACLVLLLTSLC